MSIKRERSSCAVTGLALLTALVLGIAYVPSLAAQSLEERIDTLARQVTQLNQVILELRSEIVQSRKETQELRLQLSTVEAPGASGSGAFADAGQLLPVPSRGAVPQQGTAANATPEERLAEIEEAQRLLSDRLEEQYQTKVESTSRYRVKLTGIVMLNAFANRGRVDSQEVPDLALRPSPAETGRTFGITALQSQVGLETYGPVLAGAKTSAGLQFDFFGTSANPQYATSYGAVRLRTAAMRMDWPRTSIVVGQDVPFISPLSPTSIATLAYPAFSYSGNLWTWIPQARIEHRFSVSEQSTISLQGGFFDPVPRGPAQPAYATRLAWSHGDTDRPLAFGIGGYYSREDRGFGRTEDGWAGTADWLVPLGSRFTLSGEFYRGEAIGSLGAAQGRSVVFSGPEADPATEMIGLNTIGGWAQIGFKATPTVEFHAAYGEDQPFREDLFHYSPPAAGTSLISRNRTQMYNVIYRPRTNLVFSLEYRRFRTWRIDTSTNASHVNLGVGVLF
jgi:hypothetical protein